MSDTPTRLIPKGMLGTVDTAIDELVDYRNDIAEIYVMVKYKDGDHHTIVSGNLGGFAFGVYVLQKRLLEE